LTAATLVTASAVFAGGGPSRWDNQGCHSLDAGRTLCWEDHGLMNDHVSESGQWTYNYRDDILWTVYAADGSVEHTERTTVHVVQKGQGAGTRRAQETLRYRYDDNAYSCQVSTNLITFQGEVQVDHEVGNCTIS
jgi:hypothetical protein